MPDKKKKIKYELLNYFFTFLSKLQLISWKMFIQCTLIQWRLSIYPWVPRLLRRTFSGNPRYNTLDFLTPTPPPYHRTYYDKQMSSFGIKISHLCIQKIGTVPGRAYFIYCILHILVVMCHVHMYLCIVFNGERQCESSFF